jgi:hypothetical protein
MSNMRRLGLILGLAGLLASATLFGAWFLRQQGQGQLVWDRPTVKKSIQTFAYKVYGNSRLQNGRYFMSKMVFRNTGNKPVTDFSISYQVPGYIDWTTPDVLAQIPSGHTVIKCFYPQFPKKVTEIKNDTPSALETRIRWNDGSGPTREEVLREEFIFRGVNEIEYTDLPSNEIVNWFDRWINSDLLAAMVTPNDPVVTEYAAAITEKLGGALAGAGGDNDKIAVMAGLYNYMIETGMRYAGGMGFSETVGDTSTMVQSVRLPRDVILSNNGLCIELTLLWASVLEHLGMESLVFVIPGHAFIVVPLENEINGLKFVPIECTAITPKAVDRQGPVSFAKAYELARGELAKAVNETGLYIVVNAQQLQSKGIEPPELPDIDIDQVKHIINSRRPSFFRK